jgi:hypothetical protein
MKCHDTSSQKVVRGESSVEYLPGLSRDFDCFDLFLQLDGIVGIAKRGIDSLIFFPNFDF